MLEQALDYAHAHRERFLEQLFDLLRIPSISTLSEHKPDIQRAAAWLADDLQRIGMEHVAVMPTGGHPVVYSDWLNADPDLPTVLVYGHYDIQPVDPLDLWQSPPFEPTIRDGQIYARGAADDKGQAFSHVKALESMLAAEGRLPLNVKVLIEGEEESGSDNLEAFVKEHTDLLAADSGLVSDTGFMSPDLPMIVYGLRGIVSAEVRVRGPKHDLHSGGYGGTVHNPAQAVAEIICALHNDDGSVAIPGFYDRVRMPDDAERRALNNLPYTLKKWQGETGMEKLWGEPAYTLVERIGARPTCEVNGMWGGFQGEGGKTIIPAEAGVKITMRLVPDQDPDEIGRLFTEYIEQIAPDDLHVEATISEGGWPVITPIDSDEIRAAARAYEQTWGTAPVFMRGGGSIPIVATFQRELDLPVVLMGFSVPDAGAHAPNEYFPVDHFYKGIDAIICYYHNLTG